MKNLYKGAVESAPVVLFMKGTPEFPACRFSKLAIELLSQQGVDPSKFVAFNVLEDPELRIQETRLFTRNQKDL